MEEGTVRNAGRAVAADQKSVRGRCRGPYWAGGRTVRGQCVSPPTGRRTRVDVPAGGVARADAGGDEARSDLHHPRTRGGIVSAVRAVLRFATHRITRHPDSEPTATAECLSPGCGWSVAPTSDVKHADVECMAHTGATGHAIFARRYEDVAVVVRDE
ncbi:DUF7848 domain-containing protein [Streptomyces sp. NBC_00250]|uniref:DUF7848 domain-containing protein n=1 Tax=Streptomyces sp. NBC_00250 TaxID=2903641 RepID=UPI003FA70B3C